MIMHGGALSWGAVAAGGGGGEEEEEEGELERTVVAESSQYCL